MFKTLVAKQLAEEYELPVWDILLPTGPDCIIEKVLHEEGVTDEEGYYVDIVDFSISCLLGMAIPIIGFWFLGKLLIGRAKIMYTCVIPFLRPDTRDWVMLLFSLFPCIFYFIVWKDGRLNYDSFDRESEEVSSKGVSS